MKDKEFDKELAEMEAELQNVKGGDFAKWHSDLTPERKELYQLAIQSLMSKFKNNA